MLYNAQRAGLRSLGCRVLTTQRTLCTRQYRQTQSPVVLKTTQSVVGKVLASSRTTTFMRLYSGGGGPLERKEIESRIMEILKGFEKVDQSKISHSAVFTSDLGLDSLDAVEVVMAIEEEFSIEIPDKEADEIKSIGQAIEYVANSKEAH